MNMPQGSGKIISAWDLMEENIAKMIAESQRMIETYQKIIADLQEAQRQNALIKQLEEELWKKNERIRYLEGVADERG